MMFHNKEIDYLYAGLFGIDVPPEVISIGSGRTYRSYLPRPNKYVPHQGKRECARRLRQMEKSK